MVLKLRIHRPGETPFWRDLSEPTTTLGRSPSNDIVVADPCLSRYHAALYRESSGWWLRDCGSTNGTRLHDRRILEPTRIYPGESFKIGETVVHLVEAGGEPGPLAQPAEAAGISKPASDDAAAASVDEGSGFLGRARREASRYGSDPWVFVRELLQNARDAGAQSVSLRVRQAQGRGHIECRDDGRGMSFEHARRYLFSLYASDKRGHSELAGKFGVGFWSVLRFDPQRIVVRSRPPVGEAWEVSLDGSLQTAERSQPEMACGTEIVLERPLAEVHLEERIFQAAWEHARYLRRLDEPERPLEISVNGRAVNAEISLPPPSSRFKRGSVLSVVGLGPQARVELFSRGLLVRSARCLADLQQAQEPSGNPGMGGLAEIRGGLAPQALLQSEKLELLLSRSEAREDRELGRLVSRAQRELELLIRRQLDALLPGSRSLRWLKRWAPRAPGLRRLVLVTVLAAFGFALGFLAWRSGLPSRTPDRVEGVLSASAAASATEGPAQPDGSESGVRAYTDPGSFYRGPEANALHRSGSGVDIRYTPARLRPLFRALVVPNLEGPPPEAEAMRPYAADLSCEAECLAVDVAIGEAAGPIRIPVPTGYGIVTESVFLDGKPMPLWATSWGEAVLFLDSPVAAGHLTYLTTPQAEVESAGAPAYRRSLTSEIEGLIRAVLARSAPERVEALTGWVRARVAYDLSPQVAARWSQSGGQGFVARTLAAGAGDCDVVNGLLAVLLQSAGVSSRLVVGYIGHDGGVEPWLHAWVEYRLTAQEPWRAADASIPVPLDGGSTVPEVAASGGGMLTQEPALAGDSLRQGRSDSSGASRDARRVASTEELPARIRPSARTWFSAVAVRTRMMIGIVALLTATVLAVIWLRGRRRSGPSLRSDRSAVLPELLKGALQLPESYGFLPALYNRQLIPLLGGGWISLDQARRLSRRGHLFRTAEQSPLAAAAIRSGARVLDESQPEARAVAMTLGAVDLDRWHRLLRMSRTTPLLEAVNEYLRARGERWQVRAAPGVSRRPEALDLEPLRLRQWRRAPFIVVVDSSTPWLVEHSGQYRARPETARFSALDQLLEELGLGWERRSAILWKCARAALLEAMN